MRDDYDDKTRPQFDLVEKNDVQLLPVARVQTSRGGRFAAFGDDSD